MPSKTRERGSTVAQLRRIALALPDALETITWGEPHFRIGGKIFGGIGRHDGRDVTSAKLEKPHAEALLLDPRFSPAPYVGRHGWVQFALEDVTPAELERLVHESYRLVAPKPKRKPTPKLTSKPKSKSAPKSNSAPKPKPAPKPKQSRAR